MLTLDQIGRIERSYEEVAPRAPEFAHRFFAKLFTNHPEMRPMFPEDVGAAKQRMAEVLPLLARNLRSPAGLVDPERLAIRGGSAGGYVTLCALTFHDDFATGTSYFGVADIGALAEETHKFESRYLEVLLGDESALVERSPIIHLDAFNCPVIFFQGSEDKVVPPNQSQAMADALRRKGIPVAYLEFAGEGHGFRDAKNIIRTIESEYAFFCRVFGISPAEALPAITIDNQDSLDHK